jgi:hypothetical protein
MPAGDLFGELDGAENRHGCHGRNVELTRYRALRDWN